MISRLLFDFSVSLFIYALGVIYWQKWKVERAEKLRRLQIANFFDEVLKIKGAVKIAKNKILIHKMLITDQAVVLPFGCEYEHRGDLTYIRTLARIYR